MRPRAKHRTDYTGILRVWRKNMNRQVQEVTADEPEILFIGHTKVERMDD
jgi:hypothetical protein